MPESIAARAASRTAGALYRSTSPSMDSTVHPWRTRERTVRSISDDPSGRVPGLLERVYPSSVGQDHPTGPAATVTAPRCVVSSERPALSGRALDPFTHASLHTRTSGSTEPIMRRAVSLPQAGAPPVASRPAVPPAQPSALDP